MNKLIIPGSLNQPVKSSNKWVIRTNNNVPHGTGRTIQIPENSVPNWEKLILEQPDYFIENNISYVIIMKTQDYVDMIRRQYEKNGGDYKLTPIQEMFEEEKVRREMERIDNAMLKQTVH